MVSYGSLHVLGHFVHCKCCIKAASSCVMCCACLCRSQWRGCVKASRCCGCVRESCKSHWSGWIKVANGAWADLSAFWHGWFPLKIPLKGAAKSSFSALALRSGFGAAICVAVVRNSIAFSNSVSADCSGMAASRFSLLCGCEGSTIVFCSWALYIVLECLHQGCDGDFKAGFSPFWGWWFSFSDSCDKWFNIFSCASAQKSSSGAAISAAVMYSKDFLRKSFSV